jgi:hypothetical protein|tara:strand:- start:73 stop:288 length:216 start_codon:yes stop_codon:yes gene_type:complete
MTLILELCTTVYLPVSMSLAMKWVLMQLTRVLKKLGLRRPKPVLAYGLDSRVGFFCSSGFDFTRAWYRLKL